MDQALNSYKKQGKIIEAAPISMGQINQTFLVTTLEKSYIFQQISHIFPETVHEDFFYVSNFLSHNDVLCPQIILNDEGRLITKVNGKVFRAQTYIKGQSFNKVPSEKHALEAGKLLGKMHNTLKSFSYVYKCRRTSGADYYAHISYFEKILKTYTTHDYFPKVNSLGREVLGKIKNYSKSTKQMVGHVHGDPKISNFIFDEGGCAISMVDFDTFSDFGFSKELADALRSWCNLNTEDVPEPSFDLKVFDAAVRGYFQHQKSSFKTLKDSLPQELLCMTLCLCLRYLSDTLTENYFSFDKSRFSRAAEHNWLKAQSMYALYEDIFNKFTLIRNALEVSGSEC